MKIFKFGLAIAITTALMTAQSLFGATGRAAGNVVNGEAVPDTGSTLALLFLSFFALMGASRLASFKKRKVV